MEPFSWLENNEGTIAVAVVVLVMVWYILAGLNVVTEWMRRPLLRFGRYNRTLGPGITWAEPFTNRPLDDVPINEEVWELQVKHIQTHDNVPITISLILTSKIDENNVRKYVTAVLDGDEAIEQRTLAVVSECVSGLELDQILHDRETLHDKLIRLLNSRTSHWGILIVAIEFKDISITDESIQNAIALKARAVKEGEAEIARAEVQFRIAEELNKAAAEYTEMGRWMKGTEVLLEMCRSAENNTILVPTDMVEGLARIIPKAPEGKGKA